MAKFKIKHTITKKEWNKKHKDFKSMIDGVPYIMMYDDKTGTHLVPVKIVDESVNEGQINEWKLQLDLGNVNPSEFENWANDSLQKKHKIKVSGSGKNWTIVGKGNDDRMGSSSDWITQLLGKAWTANKIKVVQKESVNEESYKVAGRPVTLIKGKKANGTDWKVKFQNGKETALSDVLSLIKPFPKLVKEESVNEAYIPSNIKEFAKRKGVTQLVNTVAGWAEKVAKGIKGGTAIGKNYNTLILDMSYNGSEIRINCEDETIELYDEPVRNFQQFKKVYNEYQMDESVNEESYKVAGRPVTLIKGKKANGTDWKVKFQNGKETALSDVLSLIKPFPKLVKEATTSDVIKDLDKAKNDLLKKVDALIAKKKKLYSDVDIEAPMSADEKKLDKDIADLFSQINKLVLQKRSVKKESVNEGNFGEIDIMAREARNFNEFVKEFYKDFRDFPKDKDTLKWLKSLYDGRSND